MNFRYYANQEFSIALLYVLQIEPMLKEWMEEASKGWSNNARVIARSWVKDGLKSRCITRDLKWGIPVPVDGYRDKVSYQRYIMHCHSVT